MSDELQYPDHFIERLHSIWGNGFLSPGGKEEVAEIVKAIDLAGKIVLDIGFGTGGPAIALASDHNAERVIGIDVEEPLRDRAQRNINAAGVSDRIELQIVSPGPLPFDAELFDAVFSKDSMVHIVDKPALFSEVLRVLKPGGVFAASDWLSGDDPAGEPALEKFKEAAHLKFSMATALEIERVMSQAGFERVTSRDRNAWFAEKSAEEVRQIEGPLRQQLIDAVGDEIVLGWTVVKKAMADAAAAGGLRPTHLLGFKPVT